MAQQQGVDYSFSRPPAATIASYGYTTVGRYVASSTGKRITLAEANSLLAAGLSIFLVFEDFANPLDNWGGNGLGPVAAYNGGVADATFAANQAAGVGQPVDRPIYVACDAAPQTIVGADVREIFQYFQGWVDTIGVSRVGMYGGALLWSQLFSGGYVGPKFWQAAAASWSNYQVPYPGAVILQGLGSPIVGYATDPDTAYIDDFGQWPKPTVVPATPIPNPKPGGTNIANVSITSSYAQPNTQSLITPTESHDQVVYSVTTTDATLTTGSHTGFYTIPASVGQLCYPIGIFSYDGGVTYNDFGFELPVIPSSAGVYPGVTLQPVVDSSGNISFNGVNNTGGTVSLIISVALLATYSPQLLSGPPKILGGNISYSNIYPKLTSDATTRVYSTYRRIAKDNVALGSSVTVAHGLGTIPNIMFWVQASGNITINPIGWRSDGTSGGALGIKMDSTNLYFHVDAGTYGNCYYRVYKDN